MKYYLKEILCKGAYEENKELIFDDYLKAYSKFLHQVDLGLDGVRKGNLDSALNIIIDSHGNIHNNELWTKEKVRNQK